MSKYYIGGVASVSAFIPDENGKLQHLFDAKTLTDSSINVSVSNEEIRGGEGAQLLGKFFHTTVFNLSLTDALFDLSYIAMQVGSTSTRENSVIMKSYNLSGTTIATDAPVALLDFGGQYEGTDLIGWGEVNGKTYTFTLTGTESPYTVTLPAGVTTYPTCITVPVTKSGEQVKVNAMYTPGTMSLIMRAKLFLGDSCKASDGKSVGQVVIEVPKFQLDGTIDLAMAMTSPATYALNGSALATGCGCDNETYYAKITEVIDNNADDPFYGYTGIVIDNNYLTQGDTIGVYAFAPGKSPKALTTAQYTVTPAGVVVNGKIGDEATGAFTVTANVTGSAINGKEDTATIVAAGA